MPRIVVAALLVAVWLAAGLRPVRDERDGLAAVRAQPQDRPPRVPAARATPPTRTRSTAPELRLAQLDALTKRPDERRPPPAGRSPAASRRTTRRGSLLAQTARTVDPALARAGARPRPRAQSAGSGGALSAPTISSATSVSAGISQSQSMPAWTAYSDERGEQARVRAARAAR